LIFITPIKKTNFAKNLTMKKVILVILSLGILFSAYSQVKTPKADSILTSGKIGLTVKTYVAPFDKDYHPVKYDEASRFPLWYQFAYIIVVYLLAIFYASTKGYPLNLYITFTTLLKIKYNANEKNNLRESIESVFFIAALLILSILFTNYLFIKNIITQQELTKYFGIILASLSLASFAYWLVVKYLSYLFEQYKAGNFVIYLNKLMISLVTYPLMILNFLIIYIRPDIAIKIYWLAIALIFIAYIIRTIYIIKYFLDARFSVFYLILYLCIVEFIPIILVFKYILN